MKLTLVLLLLALACCSLDAHHHDSHKTCKPMEKFLGAKFSGTDSEYMEELERYSDNEDGIQAAMEVKDLIETFSAEKRSEYLKLLKNLMHKCKKDWKN
ncbi:Hypothetical predicted protein [Podarcis lilfordi]|uniref:Uncharacterized protein n=1 Tax=Podarcis lilfordi TaxID=74358 RepID=A0AA35NVY7_9SAUR|nr:Hypothetical predicted protein [Podarcis lilfordi]